MANSQQHQRLPLRAPPCCQVTEHCPAQQHVLVLLAAEPDTRSGSARRH